MDEPSLILSGVALGVLLAKGWRIGLPVAAAFSLIDYLVSQSLVGVLHILLSSIVGWIPFARDREKREFFCRQKPTFDLLFFSLLLVPILVVIMTQRNTSFDLWFIRSIRAALALVVITPLTYLLIQRPAAAQHRLETGQKILRTGLWIGISTMILLAAFGPLLPSEYRSTRLAFTLFPILISSAMLFGPFQHSINLIAISILTFAGSRMGYGPFLGETPEARRLLIELLALTLGWTTWIINAQNQEALAVEEELEKQVGERTEALRNSETFLNAVVENIPDMIFVKDARNLRFVRLNRAGEELIGRARSEMIGKNDYDFFPREQADHFTAYDRSVLSSGGTQEIEERISTQKHGERWLRTKKMPIVDSEGDAQFIVGISEDITIKREAEHHRFRLIEEEAARREAEKNLALRNEFLAVAAHELRTPVSALKLSTELGLKLLDHPEPEHRAQLEELLRMARQESFQLQRLSESLVDVSRIHEGRFHVSLEKNTDLTALIEKELQLMRPVLDEARCPLNLQIQSGVRATVDPERIRQLFENLVQNASKFGQGTPIEILLHADSSRWTLEVADQGIGMDTDTLSRLFHPFERATSYRNFPGLGLGLFISREIITAHHGSTRVEGEAGRGARFIFTAPLDALPLQKSA